MKLPNKITKKRPKPFSVKIAWGSFAHRFDEGDHVPAKEIAEYAFNAASEGEAFMLGVAEANGWMGVHVADCSWNKSYIGEWGE